MINEEFRTAISDPRFENVDSCDNTTKKNIRPQKQVLQKIIGAGSPGEKYISLL
jgi:hypothetical protein